MVDALRMKAMNISSLALLLDEDHPWTLDIQSLANRFVKLDLFKLGRILAYIDAQFILLVHMKDQQFDDKN